MAKIMIIGASGTIGKAAAELLAPGNDIVRVGKSRGDDTVDLASKASIEALFNRIETVDAIVCAAGESRFAPLDQAGDEDFTVSITSKLMGQVNLVRIGWRHVAVQGSITLTSGLLAREPWPGTVPTAMVNAALHGFVRAAALDIENSIRINVVSPVYVTETAQAMDMATSGTMTASETAKAYKAGVEGQMTGQVLDVREYGSLIA
ncbi:MAG: short chain dehydrogenase [Desulfosarcinaceae bacterium]|jgi:NAD(P)-dependent dehydrogenase (short-subunit alcohol dehydrogenase family)